MVPLLGVRKLRIETMRYKSYKRLKRAAKALTACSVVLLLLFSLYASVVWFNVPYLSTLRDIWIETAMTTNDHQWLATGLFPEWLIEDVMSRQVRTDDVLGGLTLPEKDPDSSEAFAEQKDILGQKQLTVGGKDAVGNKVLVNDIEQGIVISQIKGSTFVGQLVMIDDPSRVFVATTNRKGVWGQCVGELMEEHNAVIGINGSGFEDIDGHGKGGVINGLCYSMGEPWGTNNGWPAIVFDENDRLIVGKIDDWEAYHVRDGVQFGPVLICDGEQLIKKSAGYGMQPRTIVAQRADGVVFFMIVDGRQVGYSIGATMGECADILMAYGAVNAAACDGGSSSVLAYNGKVINIPSTPMKDTGRYLPNAFLVRKK